MNEKNFLYQYQIFRAVRLKNGSLKYARLSDGFVRLFSTVQKSAVFL